MSLQFVRNYVPSAGKKHVTRVQSLATTQSLANAPMGSQAGKTTGVCLVTARISSVRNFLSMTTSYTNSENQSSDMIR